MKQCREKPEINASSMADIAFLLLIFFLVTTTINTDKGILVKLPQWSETPPKTEIHNERNVLEIFINKYDQLMIEGKESGINELETIATKFLDNNGKENCSYCLGTKASTSSDHPTDAVISLLSHRATSYEAYIQVYDVIVSSYSHLRNQYATSYFNTSFIQLSPDQQKTIKKLYPMLLSEAEPIDY